jgi:chemotaxis-related protein WspD
MEGKKDLIRGQKRCWNTIGVWGSETPRCQDLEHLAHCRNCQEFIRAGRELFDRSPPEGYLQTWTDALAAEKESKLSETISVLIFRLGREWLAMDTGLFREVSELQGVHKIPHCDDPVISGLVNIRGELQLCISLHALLEIEKDDPSKTADGQIILPRLLVAEKDLSSWVFPADEVSGIYRYDPNRLQQVPATVSRAAATYTRNIFTLGDKRVGCLDDALLFSALSRRVS